MKSKISPKEANGKLMEDNEFPFVVVMKHGTMSLEYFAPVNTDTQTPHKQDEIYVIIKGDGFFSGREKESPLKKAMYYLFQPEWVIVLKTSAMTLLPG